MILLVEWYQKSKQTTNLWGLSKKTKVPKKPGAKPHQASGKKNSVRLPVQSRHSLCFEQVKSTPAPLLPHNWCTTTPPPMIPYSPYPPPQLPPFPYPTASLQSPCSYQYPYSASYTPHTYYQPYGHQMTYQGSGFSGSSSSSVDIQHNSNSFVVVICRGNISKCTSCNGVFERDQQLVVVKHVEKSFYTKEGEVHVSGERPHYYHASESCLMSMHPYFSGELLQIESETMDTLTTENKSIVKKLFEVSQLITVCDTD